MAGAATNFTLTTQTAVVAANAARQSPGDIAAVYDAPIDTVDLGTIRAALAVTACDLSADWSAGQGSRLSVWLEHSPDQVTWQLLQAFPDQVGTTSVSPTIATHTDRYVRVGRKISGRAKWTYSVTARAV